MAGQSCHFSAVYEKYYRQIYGLCRRFASHTDDAKDMAHEVFLRYYTNIDRFRHEASPSTWMFRVAYNLAIHKWKREAIKTRLESKAQPETHESDDEETHLINQIAIKKVLGTYSERTRKIVVMHHVEMRTQQEIGKMLGVSRATVTRHLKQPLQKQ
jgi:RNA polymerase sigma-70 factor, ECF subfamily